MTDEDAIAAASAARMYESDRAAHGLGIEILEVRAGYGRVAFTIREEMLNGWGSAHGGFLFALADTAFAYACNSHGGTCVALQCSISYSAPGRVGSRVTATACERALGGRTGTYDVELVDDAGTTLGLFRGTSYRIGRDV